MNKYVRHSLLEAKQGLNSLLDNKLMLETIADAGRLLINTFEDHRRVFSCGNGGSMCDSIHFAEELTGRYRKDRPPLPAIAISDIGHFSCVGNDFGYKQVFSRYLEAHAQSGDCLVSLSTSGSSDNILYAAKKASSLGMKIIGLTGHQDAELASLCTIHICTPAGQFADRIQELHIKVLHILIELIERKFFPQNYDVI